MLCVRSFVGAVREASSERWDVLGKLHCCTTLPTFCCHADGLHAQRLAHPPHLQKKLLLPLLSCCCRTYFCSTKEHYVNRKLLVVEERHSPMLQRNSRGGENRPALSSRVPQKTWQPFCSVASKRATMYHAEGSLRFPLIL